MQFISNNKIIYKSKNTSHFFLKLVLILIILIILCYLSIMFPNFLPFIIILPFLLLFYYFNVKSSGKYTLTNCTVNNNVLIIDDGKGRKFKALAILQVERLQVFI